MGTRMEFGPVTWIEDSPCGLGGMIDGALREREMPFAIV
jgi:hypothetical protein